MNLSALSAISSFLVGIWLILSSQIIGAQPFMDAPSTLTPVSDAQVRWVDFNNDGVLDLFVAGLMTNGNRRTSIYLRDMAGGANELMLEPLSNSYYTFGDFNSDGFVDILGSGFSQTGDRELNLYRNQGGAAFQMENFNMMGLSNGGLLWSDLDHDGDLDILATGIDESGAESTYLYELHAGGYTPRNDIDLPDIGNGVIVSADFNVDGRPEVVLTGMDATGFSVTKVFTFGREFQLIDYGAQLPGLAFGSLGISDMNQDGNLDLVGCGLYGDSLQPRTFLWLGNGVNGFVEADVQWMNVSSGWVSVGDLNEDGRSDLAIVGVDGDGFKQSLLYWNTETGFESSQLPIFGLIHGQIDLGDFDSDQDLDIVYAGDSDAGFQAGIISNDDGTSINEAPSVPENLQASVLYDSVRLSWNPSQDDLTSGTELRYNLYLSRQTEGSDWVISPLAAVPSGAQRLPCNSNVGYKAFLDLSGLPEGIYYWGVQAIDNSLHTSAFSMQASFTICHRVSLGPDLDVCHGTSLQLELGTLEDNVDWYRLNGQSLLSDSRLFSLIVNKTDTLVAQVTKPQGCSVRDTLVVTHRPLPTIELGQDRYVCYNSSVVLDVGSDLVEWHRKNRESVLSSQLSFNVIEIDTVVAQINDEFGCVQSDTVVVRPRPLPFFSIGDDREVCQGQEVLISATNAELSYSWHSSKMGNLPSASGELLLIADHLDTIDVIGADLFGCIWRDTAVVSVLPLPQIDIGENRAVCVNQSVSLSVPGTWNAIQWRSTNNSLLKEAGDYSHLVSEQDTITCLVQGLDGCWNSDSLVVTPLALPIFSLGPDIAICGSESVLVAVGTGFDEVDWYSVKTDSLILSNSWFIEYQPEASDTLAVTVTNADGCTSMDSVSVTVKPLPGYSLGEDVSVCSGEDVSLTLEDGWKEVNWYTHGDILLGSGFTLLLSAVVDTISVWTEVTNSYNCTAFDSIKVTALEVPGFELPEVLEVCEDELLTIPSPLAAMPSYEWSVNREPQIDQSHTFLFRSDTSAIIELKIENELGCSWLDSAFVEVNKNPGLELIGPAVACWGDTIEVRGISAKNVEWQWSQNVGRVETYVDSLLAIVAERSDTVHLTVIDLNGCKNDRTAAVVVNPLPMADAGPDVQLCDGESSSIGGAATLASETTSWRPVFFLNDPETPEPLASPPSSMSYVLTVTNEFGCASKDTVFVEVNPDIIVDAGTDAGVCLGDRFTLGGSPSAQGSKFPYHFEWITSNSILGVAESNPVIEPIESATYYLLVSSGHCALEIDSIRVTVHSIPDVEISERQSIGHGESVKLYAAGGIEYKWSPTETIDDPTKSSPIVSPLITTVYTASIVDDNGCQNTASVEVLVQDVLFVPSFFSPNADGMNDVFRVYESGVETIDLRVYDFDGNLLFDCGDVESCRAGWDGTRAGLVAPTGTYVWVVTGTFYNKEPLHHNQQSRGFVILQR